MRLRNLMVVAVVMMALAACRGDRETITGSYGGGILAGTVVLDGIAGTPEGVEVSVRDTGMTMTLAADGRFAFSGVPEDAILDFRRADGIQASLGVNGSKGSMFVRLGQSGASKGNRNKDKVEFEGVIKTANADEILLLASRHSQEILIGLTTETVIRKGNQILTAADLQPEMHVHVRARKVEDKLVAQQIVVQEEGEDDDGEDDEEKPELRQYEGTVLSASATELKILDSHRAEVTFALNAETVIRKGQTTVLPADLLPGQRVHVKATVAADGAATAVLVILQNTRDTQTVSVSGTVLGVAGSDITIKTKSGDTWTVQTSAATRIRMKGKAITLAQITAGDSLSAKGKKVSDNTILASEVDVRGKSGHP